MIKRTSDQIVGGSTVGHTSAGVIGVGAVSAANMLGSQIIDTPAVALDLIQHAQVALSSADILALNTGKTILASVSGKTINVVRYKFAFTFGTVAYQNGTTLQLAYTGGTPTLGSTIAASVVNAASGTTSIIRGCGDVTGAPVTTGIVLITSTNVAFITGDGTATVDIWYTVQ